MHYAEFTLGSVLLDTQVCPGSIVLSTQGFSGVGLESSKVDDRMTGSQEQKVTGSIATGTRVWVCLFAGKMKKCRIRGWQG
jgi:hypothetical protein